MQQSPVRIELCYADGSKPQPVSAWRGRGWMVEGLGRGARKPVAEVGKNAKAYLLCFFLTKWNDQG